MSRCSVKMMSLRGQPFRSVVSALSCRIAAQLGPLAVGAGIADLLGRLGQVGELDEFGVEFLDGLGGGGRVEQFLFEFLDLFGVVVVGVEAARGRRSGSVLAVGAVEDLLLLALEPLGCAGPGSCRWLRGWTPGGAAAR